MTANNLLRTCLPLLLAFPAVTNGFSPVVHRTVPLKTSEFSSPSCAAPASSFTSSTTACLMMWPGKSDAQSEAEGKRDAESRLKLSGTEIGALSTGSSSSSFLSDTKRIEEFVAPVSNVLDGVAGGWALSYANLDPEDETTPIGISFLATNIAYGLCGFLLVSQGNAFLGVLTELACFASFCYHYSQLKFGQEGSRIVRLALLMDYFFALSAILVGSTQLFFSHQLPVEALGGGALAVTSLGLCWVWEEGVAYIVLHSLWHFFSAYTGYVIGSVGTTY